MSNLPLHEQVHLVNDRDQAISFIIDLASDLETNPEDWENGTLKNYLMAMAQWIGDMDGWYKNQQQEPPKDIPWGVFVNILMAAKIYE